MKNLLKKWLAGATTWEEEKNLRRAAAKEDFLGEALEGYDAFPTSNHMATIERLKSRLPKTNKQEERKIFTLPRVAAAAAMIGAVTTFFWVQNQVQSSEMISQNTEKLATPTPQQDIVPIPKQTIELTENQPEKVASTQPQKDNVVRNKTNVSNTPQLKTPPIKPNKQAQENETANLEIAAVEEEMTPLGSTASTIPNPPAVTSIPDRPPVESARRSESVSAYATSAPTEETLPESSESLNDLAAAEGVAAAGKAKMERQAKSKASHKKSKIAEKINLYVGQVQNEDGQPLHDVKIVGVNTSFKTATQMNGDFILKTTEPLQEITVTKDGFHPRNISINQYSDFLNVSLVKKSTKNLETATKMEIIAPKPQKGFVHFFDYLSTHLKYPEAAKKAGIKREVEIRFYIDENGTPTDLKVHNPDPYGFDKEAIRLLKNGPKWEPINSHAKYFVTF